MRFLACAVLLWTATCSRSEAADVCPQDCCFGMHSFNPPATCEKCGAKEVPTRHHYCVSCADSMGRCPHCGGKRPPASQPTSRAPEPKPLPPPPPPAPAPAKKAEVASESQKLVVEAVEVADPNRHCHGALAFGATGETAARVRDAHRKHKAEEIAKLPALIAGSDVALYLVWGHHPKPVLEERQVRAEYFAKEGMIRVTVPPWSGRRPEGGIGMDWGVDEKKEWPFVGFRAKLSELPAGDYAFEVIEVESKNAEPRVLSSGRVTLIQKK